ncbi:MAG: carbohydrate ABC transporter permease [Clostridia bacterium]|nr:carbohydrate ABC transporter permease [Clostridia bacterium]
MKSLKALNKSRKVNRSKAGTAVLFIVLLIFALVMAFPMALIIANAFKPQDELWVFPPRLIPNSPTLENFRNMFTVMSNSQVPFVRYIFNTLLITSVGTVGHIILSSMCAFPLAKKKFPGSKIIFKVIVLALMFNATVTAIPNFLTMSWIGWINTYLALIVPAFGAPIGLYLMKQFIEQLPDSLLEAARIDGAGQWQSFWQIVMPNVKAAWLTLFLLSFQSLWGIGATSYIYKEELKTLPYALSQILSSGISRAGVGAAVSVFMLIIPVCIFIFSQSNIIETMASSGMKE